MQYRVERLGIHIAAFFVAGCQLFTMYPFVVPFFMAAYLQEKSGISLFIVLMLGVWQNAGMIQMLRYAGVLLFLMVMLGKTDRKQIFSNNLQIACASGMILFSLSMPFQYIVTARESSVLVAALEGVIAASMTLVLEKGMEALRVGTNRMFATNERFIGLFSLILLMLVGCPDVEIPVHVPFLLGSILLTVFSYRFESGIGITAGSIAGLALAFQTGKISALAVFIVLACLITLLRGLGKIGVLLAYVAGVILLGILYEPALLQAPVLIAALLTSFLFLILPLRRKQGIVRHYRGQGMDSEEVLAQKVVGNRVRDFGEAFCAMEKMLDLHEQERDSVYMGGISNIYLSGDGISLLNVVESENNRLQEIRKNFIKQLGQVGEMFAAFQTELNEKVYPIDYFESRMKERAERMGVCVNKVLPIKGRDEKLQVYLSCYAVKHRIVTGRQLAEKMSSMVGKRMICVGKGDEAIGTQEEILLFVEQGRYMLTTGVTRKERRGEHCCGDNFSITKLDTQKAVLMLSDGMGSGESAFLKSEQIVDLLEQFLAAGFCRELAIELLNSFISFMTDGRVSSTLDLVMIDFYTGTADFIKLGASTTFIKRGKRVECIHSTSLPVGVLEQVEFDTCKRLLYHGDIIVMVSDGVLDGILFENKEAYLADYIAGMEEKNVQVMAEQILQHVESMQGKGLLDDSTVLVAGVWER